MEKNQLRQRVAARLRELQVGAVEAAQSVGLERNYIRDLLEEKKESFSHAKMPLVAKALKLTVPELTGDAVMSVSRHGDGTVDDLKGVNSSVRNPTLHQIPADQLMGRVDLPVYSIVQGGRGALVLSNEPYTRITRPHILLGLRDAYGVLVKGNSMAREYSEGDIAYVDPHRHPKEGDPCVFQCHKEDGTVEAIIKYLARSPDASDAVWYVEQMHPPKKFTLKKAEWQICHVAVGKQSGR